MNEIINKQEVINNLNIKNFYENYLPEIRWQKGWGQCLCPYHDDHNPSFYIDEKTARFHCKSCGKKGSVFDFYMEKHNVDFRTALKKLAGKVELKTEPVRKIVATYDYTDESGQLFFQVVRTDPKGFWQRKPDGNGGWINSIKGVRLVPYNTHGLRPQQNMKLFFKII